MGRGRGAAGRGNGGRPKSDIAASTSDGNIAEFEPVGRTDEEIDRWAERYFPFDNIAEGYRDSLYEYMRGDFVGINSALRKSEGDIEAVYREHGSGSRTVAGMLDRFFRTDFARVPQDMVVWRDASEAVGR